MDFTDAYRPPVSLPAVPQAVLGGDPALPIGAECRRSGMLDRRIQLSGRYEGELRWNASGSTEFISLNGQIIDSKFVIWKSVPRFEADVAYGDTQVHLVVEVSVRLVYFTTALRLTINDELVWQEGDVTRLDEQRDWRPRKAR